MEEEEDDDDNEQKKKKKKVVRQSFGKVLVWITQSSCGTIISPLLFRETSKKPSCSQDKHNLDTPQNWAL